MYMDNSSNNSDKIKQLIDEIAPFLHADGGIIEFVKYENNIVYVHLSGSCENCELIDYTLKDGILNYLKEQMPEIEDVINIPV